MTEEIGREFNFFKRIFFSRKGFSRIGMIIESLRRPGIIADLSDAWQMEVI